MINKTTRRVLAGMGVAAVAGVLSVSDAAAQTATDNLTVTAAVVANCLIEAPNTLAFGDYDPADVNATNPLDEDTTIRVRCTKGSPNVYIGLGLGANATGSQRRMLGAVVGEFLNYELYKDGARAVADVWGDDAATGQSYTALNNGWADLTVFGRVDGGQDVSVDDYEDTVVATVNF